MLLSAFCSWYPNWFPNASFYSLALWLMFSLFGLLLLFIAIIVIKGERANLKDRIGNGGLGKGVMFAIRRMILILTGGRAIKRASRFGLYVILFLAGYYVRGYRDLSQVRERYNLRVIHRSTVDSSMYTIETASGAKSDIKFCPRVPSFDDGATIEYMKYRDLGDCLQVNGDDLYFRVARDKQGQPILYKEISDAK